ncbi:DUF2513 domain-containing protein [Sphingomonas silueang]|uniref:DUF2513 domain-containing protein n=1 Tax=Sphingomonas silueang TaxID=3156617 RepID=UPI0032B4BB4B
MGALRSHTDLLCPEGNMMKRDMDLIRDLLLLIEGGKKVFELLDAENAAALGVDPTTDMTAEEVAKYEYHLELLQEAGFVELTQRSGGNWYVKRMTYAGHDFLDSVRDPEIWRNTKKNAALAGGFSVDLLKALAKGLLKKKIEQHTGVEMEF